MEVYLFTRVLFRILLLSLSFSSFGLSPLILYIYTENKFTYDEHSSFIEGLKYFDCISTFYKYSQDPGLVDGPYTKTVVIRHEHLFKLINKYPSSGNYEIINMYNRPLASHLAFSWMGREVGRGNNRPKEAFHWQNCKLRLQKLKHMKTYGV